MTTSQSRPSDRLLIEAVRQACLETALAAYEDASIRGLCPEGAWEAAISAIRMLDLSEAADHDA